MENITAILIDDESKARELLKNMLEEFCPQVTVVDLCHDIPSAVKSIHKHKPALVFSDIEMPGYSGLDLLKFFNEDEIHFSIVFTTAYDQYAIRAMKMSAIDYLLKPIEPNELQESVERYIKKTELDRKNDQLILTNYKTHQASKLAVPTRNGYRFIDPASIIFIKADNSYTELVLNTGEKLVASRILKNFEEALAGNPLFYRTHKSYLINTNYILEYVKSEGGHIVMYQNHQVAIAPDRVQDFMDKVIAVKR